MTIHRQARHSISWLVPEIIIQFTFVSLLSIVDLVTLRHEVQTVLLVIVQLCQRNSGKMDEAGREVRS